MIGRTVGRFRIIEKLGEGGMGSVWKAEDPLLGRTLALKFLPEAVAASSTAKQRFLREARAASTLNHVGIATVYDAGESDGLVYIAMVLVDGSTVSDLVARGGLPPQEAVRIARAVAEALGHAHSRGVLHRDVTGRNVMVGRDGRVVVVDFGLALPEGQTRLTMTGTALGTVAYMAPEVIQGKEGDRRSDLYGLGVILYEMLTGTLPFRAPRAEALMYATVHEEAEAPSIRQPGLPPSVDGVVLRSLAKSPQRRFQSAEEMAAGLADLANQLDSRSPGAAAPALDRVRGVRIAPPTGAGDLSMLETTPLADARVPVSPVRLTPAWSRISLPLKLPLTAIAGLAVFLTVALGGYLFWSGQRARAPVSLAAPAFESVAVLPLKNISSDPSQSDYLSIGITQALITKFTQVLNLRVTPWVSVAGYEDPQKPLTEIARDLHVGALVVGTFAMEGGRIQCSISLVDAKTGQQFWADDIEEVMGDLFALQRRIAMGVAVGLRGRLSGQEQELLAQPVARSVEAYDNYLHGAAMVQSGDVGTADQALAFFDEALRLDPELADAHVGKGAVYADRYFRGEPGGARNLEAAQASFRRALKLNPAQTGAQRGLISTYWELGRSEDALRVGKEAERSGREDVETLFVRASAFYFGGMADRAVPLFRRIVELDPVNEGAQWFLVTAAAWAGQFTTAIEAGESFIGRFGDDPEVHTWIGYSYHGLGDLEQARKHYELANESFGENSTIYVLLFTGSLYSETGEQDKARRTWERAVDIASRRLKHSPDNQRMRCWLAILYAKLGQVDGAHEQGHRLVDSSAGGDYYRAFAYASMGDIEGALAILRSAVTRRASDYTLFKTSVRPLGGEALVSAPGFAAVDREMKALDDQLRARY